MKAVLLTILGSLLMEAPVFGQIRTDGGQSKNGLRPPSVQVSPNIGFSSFALKAPGYEIGPTAGMVVGFNTFIPLGSRSLDLQLGAQYLPTGGAQEGAGITSTLSFSYLAVPLGLRWKLGNDTQTVKGSYFLLAGASSAFLLSAKQRVSSQGLSLEEDIKAETNTFDLIPFVGCGASYNLGEGHEILFDIALMQGTRDVLKNYANNKNQGMTASLSYSIEL